MMAPDARRRDEFYVAGRRAPFSPGHVGAWRTDETRPLLGILAVAGRGVLRGGTCPTASTASRRRSSGSGRRAAARTRPGAGRSGYWPKSVDDAGNDVPPPAAGAGRPAALLGGGELPARRGLAESGQGRLGNSSDARAWHEGAGERKKAVQGPVVDPNSAMARSLPFCGRVPSPRLGDGPAQPARRGRCSAPSPVGNPWLSPRAFHDPPARRHGPGPARRLRNLANQVQVQTRATAIKAAYIVMILLPTGMSWPYIEADLWAAAPRPCAQR